MPPSSGQSMHSRGSRQCAQGILDLIQGRLGTMSARLQVAEPWPAATRLTRDTLAALFFHERNEPGTAHNLLIRSLPNARQSRSPDTLIITHLLLARLALQRGERQAWLRYLLELERLGQQAGCWRIQCSAWLEQAREATLDNRLDMARQALQMADHLSDWDQPAFLLYANDVDNPFMARQRLRIAEGSHAEAIADLLPAITRARACQHHRRELKLLLLLAMAYDGNKQGDAMPVLEQALNLACVDAWLQSFIEEGERLALLLRRWASQRQVQPVTEMATQFCAELLRRIDGDRRDMDCVQALTGREIKVLQLLAMGHRNRVIAEKLFLSECTVKTHLHRINRKLGTRDRNQALAIARRRGWLD
jgi:LuxR family maltose regulon positive regulatory protein